MVSHGNGTVMVMVMVRVKCVGLVWFGLGKECEKDG